MSIIAQALKKAQREQQRQHHAPLPLPRASLQPIAPSRRRWQWLLVSVGGVIIVGIGLFAQFWRPRPPSPPLAMTAQTTSAQLRDRDSEVAAEVPVAPAAPNPVISMPLDAPPQVPSPATLALAEPEPVVRTQATPELTPVAPLAHREEPTVPASLTLPASTPTPKPKPVMPRATAPSRPKATDYPQAETRFNQGLEALKAGKEPEAEQLFLQAIALNPTLKAAYNSLGNLHYQRQEYSHAKVMYEHALEIDPNDVKARNNLGNTYMQLTMHDEAIAELRKVIAVSRESSLAYYNLACVYARTGDESQAAEYLNQAIEREPQARAWARTDADFTPVRSTPEFQKLLGAS